MGGGGQPPAPAPSPFPDEYCTDSDGGALPGGGCPDGNHCTCVVVGQGSACFCAASAPTPAPSPAPAPAPPAPALPPPAPRLTHGAQPADGARPAYMDCKGRCAGTVKVAADNYYTVYVNGVKKGAGDNWGVPDAYEFSVPNRGRIVVAIDASDAELEVGQGVGALLAEVSAMMSSLVSTTIPPHHSLLKTRHFVHVFDHGRVPPGHGWRQHVLERRHVEVLGHRPDRRLRAQHRPAGGVGADVLRRLGVAERRDARGVEGRPLGLRSGRLLQRLQQRLASRS
jgi:hypothetical protein